MELRLCQLALAMLAVWRITHLLSLEDGPWGLLVRVRRLAGQGFWGELLDCFYCLSLWVGVPFAVLLTQEWRELLLLWPALSGGAILIEKTTGRNPVSSQVIYSEDELAEEERKVKTCAVAERE